MIEILNRDAFRLLHLPLDPGSPALFAAHALAQWLVWLLPAVPALLWIFGDRRDRLAAVPAVAAAALALALAKLLATAMFHPRPFSVEPVRNALNLPADSSFPSVQAALFFAAGLSFVLARPPSWPRVGLLVIAGGLVVGWMRILLGAHYPLDILASALIAGVVAPIIRTRPLAEALGRLTVAVERLYGFVLPQPPHPS